VPGSNELESQFRKEPDVYNWPDNFNQAVFWSSVLEPPFQPGKFLVWLSGFPIH
jgi:hypothetical protein